MTLPTHHATARMRIWRALKALGCGVLRDGVYLLPDPARFRQVLQDRAEDIKRAGGTAHMLELARLTESQEEVFERLFDRSEDYARLVDAVQEAGQALQSEPPAKVQRLLERLRKTFAEILAVDFFPGAAREQAKLALEDLGQALAARLCPDEPHAVQRAIKRLSRDDYRSCIWATRQRPWIDRLASAWLIRRFIDPDARFLWLITPSDCPAEVLGYDFDGAAFTHVGAKVTFEVLLASFGLAGDAALERLAALVHYLDIGGIPVPEAPGLAALIRGMQQRLADDDALLTEALAVFDSFYQHFSGPDA